MRRLPALVALLIAAALPARAAPPRVVTDIAPVYALVAAVMEGVGTPDLLLPPGASPHDHSMRPSEAGALARADLVFWIGPVLTPWLAGTLANLGGSAQVVTLSEIDGTVTWPARDTTSHAPLEGHTDPHLWLDPANGLLWIDSIQSVLGAADPANATRYALNAQAARDAIKTAVIQATAQLKPSSLAVAPYLVSHDSWQYLERYFDLPASWAILGSEAQRPTPAHILALQNLVQAKNISCILAEPPVNSDLIRSLFADRPVKIIPVDPLGTTLKPGPDLYPELLRQITTAIQKCNSP